MKVEGLDLTRLPLIVNLGDKDAVVTDPAEPASRILLCDSGIYHILLLKIPYNNKVGIEGPVVGRGWR